MAGYVPETLRRDLSGRREQAHVQDQGHHGAAGKWSGAEIDSDWQTRCQERPKAHRRRGVFHPDQLGNQGGLPEHPFRDWLYSKLMMAHQRRPMFHPGDNYLR